MGSRAILWNQKAALSGGFGFLIAFFPGAARWGNLPRLSFVLSIQGWAQRAEKIGNKTHLGSGRWGEGWE